MPSEHARLSPSAAERWLHCPGSVALCASVVDHGSRDAEEGTACHWLLEQHLAGNPRVAGDVAPNGIETSAEHHKLVTPVIEWIEDYRRERGATLLAEQRVEIGSFAFGLAPGEMFGTADVVGVSRSELLVLDAKFGYVDVPVKKNPQVISYGLGTLYATGWMHDRVRLVIAQPRCGEPKEIIYTAAEMQAFEDEYRPRVREAHDGGPLRPTTTLPPGEDADPCRWCRAQAVCPALRDEVMKLAQREMADPITLSPEEIADLLNKGDVVENALRALRAHAIKLMELGTPVPGWKRVQGDKHRTWRDEKIAVTQIAKLGIDPSILYVRKLGSPAQVEDQLTEFIHGEAVAGRMDVATPYEQITEKKLRRLTRTACKTVAAKAVGIAGAFKPEGDATLVRADDPRPELPPAFTAEELAQTIEQDRKEIRQAFALPERGVDGEDMID